MTNLRERIDTAVAQLRPYGVTERNMGELVGHSLKIRDLDAFIDILGAVEEDG